MRASFHIQRMTGNLPGTAESAVWRRDVTLAPGSGDVHVKIHCLWYLGHDVTPAMLRNDGGVQIDGQMFASTATSCAQAGWKEIMDVTGRVA